MNFARRSIAVELLREVVTYDAQTGKFIWNARAPDRFSSTSKLSSAHRAKIFNVTFAGKEAGSLTQGGYITLTIWGVPLLAHRAAFAFMTGEWPEHEIDHENGDKADNRWINIRHVTRVENALNLARRRDNLTGVVGVGWYPRTKKWRARITVGKITRTLGSFGSFEDARAARMEAERKLGFHLNHGRPAA